MDDKSQRIYYFNEKENISQWDFPCDGFNSKGGPNKLSQGTMSPPKKNRSRKLRKASRIRIKKCEAAGCTVTKTNAGLSKCGKGISKDLKMESKKELSEKKILPSDSDSDEESDKEFRRKISGTEELSAVWTKHENDEGKTYYYNPTTEESVWELPEGAQVSYNKLEKEDDEDTGIYYEEPLGPASKMWDAGKVNLKYLTLLN